MVASLIQFNRTKCFCYDLTLVFEDAQCFNFISISGFRFLDPHIFPEDGSEIELKHYASSKRSVNWSQKYFVRLNWIRLATNPSWLDSSIGRVAVQKPEDANSNPARDNEFFVVVCSVRLI